MTQPKTNPLVEKQYSEWVYPKPVADLAAWAQAHCLMCDPAYHAPLIWPERAPPTDCKILVAGCGTSQAAILAYTNPEAQVIGIDISAASLKYAEELKARQNLANLTLHHMDLFDAEKLGKQFDLIYATGVLHHLPEPTVGLKALKNVLADNGVLCVMLYAHYGRAGLERVQSALRHLGAEQNTEGLARTRKLLETIPRWHPAQPYLRGAAGDLTDDACMVDTFLHKQERSFTVPQILELVQGGGLHFQGWTDNLDYYPDANVPPEHPSFKAIAALPDAEQWIVSELLYQHLGIHSFLVRKENNQNLRPDFKNSAFEFWIPARRYLLEVTEEQGMLLLERDGNACRLDGLQRELFLSVDGIKNCGEILKKIAPRGSFNHEAILFFERMWKLGHLTYRKA